MQSGPCAASRLRSHNGPLLITLLIPKRAG